RQAAADAQNAAIRAARGIRSGSSVNFSGIASSLKGILHPIESLLVLEDKMIATNWPNKLASGIKGVGSSITTVGKSLPTFKALRTDIKLLTPSLGKVTQSLAGLFAGRTTKRAVNFSRVLKVIQGRIAQFFTADRGPGLF